MSASALNQLHHIVQCKVMDKVSTSVDVPCELAVDWVFIDLDIGSVVLLNLGGSFQFQSKASQHGLEIDDILSAH